MNTLPPFSVVVCTRDRPDDLRECLAALAALDYPEYEVVVVDNASSGNATREVVAAAAGSAGAGRGVAPSEARGATALRRADAFAPRYVREDRPGLDWARNRGAREARHDLIAYVDDDARPMAGWLRGYASAFADPDTLAATGLVLPAELATPAQRLYESGRGMGRGTAPRRFHWNTMNARERIATHEIGVGANMAFRRSALALVGEFDTALDVGTPARGAGDLDMLFRVLRAGGVVRYEPSAAVRHRHRRDFAGLARQLADNGCSFGVYLLKRWRDGGAARRAAVEYAASRWVPWLLTRTVRSAVGLHAFPLALTWAELRGALAAPRAHRLTYARDRALRGTAPLTAAGAPPAADHGTEESHVARRS